MEDEGSVSAYEIYSSGLVEVLLQLLTTSSQDQGDEVLELQKLRIELFVKCFKVNFIYIYINICISICYFITYLSHVIIQEKRNEKNTESCASVLVQKLISVLESIERLPVYLYESPGAFHGLQVNIIYLI